jgi:hypothetical protein
VDRTRPTAAGESIEQRIDALSVPNADPVEFPGCINLSSA